MNKRVGHISTIGLLAIFLALVGALFYSRWIRMSLLPAELRYIPPEANVIVAVGDIASLWDGMEFHFGRIMRERDRKGALAEFLKTLEDGLAEEGVPVQSKTDLICKYGLDIDRGILIGMSLDLPDPDQTFGDGLLEELERNRAGVVIPVANQAGVQEKYCESTSRSTTQRCPKLADDSARPDSEDKLVRFFCALNKGNPPKVLGKSSLDTDYPCSAGVLDHGVAGHIYDFEGLMLAFPEPDVAFLTSSCEYMDRGLGQPRRNLSYVRGDDVLFEAVRYHLRRPLLAGPSAFVYLRGLVGKFAPAGAAAAALNFVPDAILLDVRMHTDNVNLRIADDAVAPALEERPWREYFGDDAGAVLVARDQALARYLELVRRHEEIDASIREFLGGILVPASRLEHLEQLVFAAVGYQEGVPMMSLGLWGNTHELDDLVFETQRSLRDARDRAVLTGAYQAYVAQEGRPPASLEELFDSGLLGTIDHGAYFGRFSLVSGELRSEPLTREDFDIADYRGTHERHDITYLEPRLSELDLLYRISDLEDSEKEVLLENRYRLTSAMSGDTLWVSMGSAQLEALLDNKRAGYDRFTVGEKLDSRGDKLRLLADVDSLIRIGLLSGESDIREITEELLLDLRYHRQITVSLRPAGVAQGVQLILQANGPTGEAGPGPSAREEAPAR